MKHLGWMAAAGLAALALAGCQKKENQAKPQAQAPSTPAAGPVETPRRKAGLWEITMTTAGVPQTQRLCVNAATDERLGLTGQERGPRPCKRESATRTPAGYEVRSVCDVGEMGTVTSRATLTGDPGSHYKVDIIATTAGARAPEANGTRSFTMEAAWKGPCPAGMKPGDMEVAGHRFNVIEVEKRASDGE